MANIIVALFNHRTSDKEKAKQTNSKFIVEILKQQDFQKCMLFEYTIRGQEHIPYWNSFSDHPEQRDIN